MKSFKKRFGAVAFAAAMLLAMFPVTVFADATVFDVSTAEEFQAVSTSISASGAGDYVVNIKADITSDLGMDLNTSGANVTVKGEGHTLTFPNGTAFVVSNSATLNLGDSQTALTIKGGSSSSAQGLIYVLGSASVCNMYDKVTLKDNKINNGLGGGISVQSGTLNMYGGNIRNCGVDGGSVCYGGGVAVFSGGTFIMDNGTIDGCYATSDYVDDYDPSRCFPGIGGGVFVSAGSIFTMNGGKITNNTATNFGGGLGLDVSYDEIQASGMGYIKSKATINDGEISGNTAANGAGICASGYFYSFASALLTKQPATGVTSEPGLYVNGGKISNNAAEGSGGGVFIAMLRPTIKVRLHNAEISGNTAEDGAGVEVFGYWTQSDIDGCTITNNTAQTKGGGLALINNSSGNGTALKNTEVSSNRSGDKGAGIYYDANSKLTISGTNTVQNNLYNGADNNLNIFSTLKPVYVGGDLSGSKIGLSDPTLWGDGLTDVDPSAVSSVYLTSGYGANNQVAPDTYFTSDHLSWSADYSDDAAHSSDVRLVRKPYEYIENITLTKTYLGKENYDNAGDVLTTQGVFSENVTFTVTPFKSFDREVGKTDIPAFAESSYTIPVGSGSDQIELELPDYTAAGIGDYWYEVTETQGTTAGVGYDDKYYLHIVVSHEDLVDPTSAGVSQITVHKTAPNNDGTYVNDEDDKVQGFTNDYGAGSLTVTKRLTGNMVDRDKKFDVTVTFSAPSGKTVTGPISYADTQIAGGWTGTKSVTLSLGKDESVTFTNIPDSVTYTITEADYSALGYDIPAFVFDNTSETGDTVPTATAWNNASANGTISDSADTVTITNNKTTPIDVGVVVENTPFIIIIVFVIAGAVAVYIIRRRKRLDDLDQ